MTGFSRTAEQFYIGSRWLLPQRGIYHRI